MVGFSLGFVIEARCTKCQAEVDPDTLRKAERVLTSEPGVYFVSKPNACPRCGGSSVRVGKVTSDE